MAWITVKPENVGGGRPRRAPAARFYPKTGQLALNHAAVALLGVPRRVYVQVEPELRRIRLQPAPPADGGAFTLAGGGNTPFRVSLKAVLAQHPQLAGAYRVVRSAGGIECIREGDGDE